MSEELFIATFAFLLIIFLVALWAIFSAMVAVLSFFALMAALLVFMWVQTIRENL